MKRARLPTALNSDITNLGLALTRSRKTLRLIASNTQFVFEVALAIRPEVRSINAISPNMPP
jgi:hypothetical protein